MGSSDVDVITAALRSLVGLPLSVTRRAADLRGFHFGEMRPTRRGNSGAYVLHVQCPWRLEHQGCIYTGSADLREPSSDCAQVNDWTYELGNLQDERLTALLGGRDPDTKSILNTSGMLVVKAASGTEGGGVLLELSGGYRLVVFPDGSNGESWRLLGHHVAEHLVVVGGQIESADE
jgi:hypothetical protein